MRRDSKYWFLALVFVLSACSATPTFEIPFYSGDKYDNDGKIAFNHDLFYRNDPKIGGPDPFIFDNTSRDGYYYIYSTIGLYYVGRSKDLMNWEGVGSALPASIGDSSKNMKQVLYSHYWAPEVAYDEETGKYYFFCSARSNYGNTFYMSNSFVGISDNAYGPFYICNFKNATESIYESEGYRGVGPDNVHDFDTQTFSEPFASYLFLEPGKFNEAINRAGLYTVGTTGYLRSIDFHPYTDPDDGKKYLYFVHENSGSSYVVYGMEMENWLKPKWETFGAMVVAGSYTVADAISNSPDKPAYESGSVNEGPAVIKHNGKYYMAVSNGDYTNTSYCLIQAVSDSPLGPYRKLNEEQNAVFMSSQLQGSENVSSSGHNGFITVDDELYTVYHKHRSYNIGGSDRVAAVDKIKWITIKDENGENLDVMYANGPTDTIQPRIEKYSDYRNIAIDATPSLIEGSLAPLSDLKWINDDLLSTYKTENDVINNYVRETEISKTSTIKFDFDSPKSVRAIMVYNSKKEDQIFKNISEVKIEFEYNGQQCHSIIKDLKFGSDFYEELEDFNIIVYVTPAANAFAEFSEIANVKSVSFTIDVPAGSQSGVVGLSEIVILGR